MTTPNIKRMTPIVASHLSLIKYNPKIAINKPKNIAIIILSQYLHLHFMINIQAKEKVLYFMHV